MMRSFIISLAILGVISWTGFALNCLKCVKKNSETCEGVSVECPGSKACMVMSELYKVHDNVTRSIRKDCSADFGCNLKYYSTEFDKIWISYNVQCCNEDNCNTFDFQLPPEPKEPKGRTCPACRGDEMKECVSDHEVQCLSKDDKCFEVISKIKNPGNEVQLLNFKGCVSAIVCTYGFGMSAGMDEIKTDRFNCSG